MGQLGEQAVVASLLVAGLLGCSCCIMRASGATELAASSSGLMQADDDIPGHAWCAGHRCSELAPGPHAAPQVARVHLICRMMQPTQLCSLLISARVRCRRLPVGWTGGGGACPPSARGYLPG